MNIMEGKKGEVLANGDFATGNFDKWGVGDPARIYLAQQDGGNVAVLAPAPAPNDIVLLDQLWDIPAPGGEYGISFDFRVSDAAGAPIEGLYRHFGCFLWFHPRRDFTESGLLIILSSTAMPHWRTRSYRFVYQAQRPKRMEFNLYNPSGEGDGIPRQESVPENVTVVDVPDPIQLSEEPELVPGFVHIACRNFRLFKIN